MIFCDSFKVFWEKWKQTKSDLKISVNGGMWVRYKLKSFVKMSLLTTL